MYAYTYIIMYLYIFAIFPIKYSNTIYSIQINIMSERDLARIILYYITSL